MGGPESGDGGPSRHPGLIQRPPGSLGPGVEGRLDLFLPASPGKGDSVENQAGNE